MVIEIDQAVKERILDGIRGFDNIKEVTYVDIYKNNRE
jgi:hypothetical protein